MVDLKVCVEVLNNKCFVVCLISSLQVFIVSKNNFLFQALVFQEYKIVHVMFFFFLVIISLFGELNFLKENIFTYSYFLYL
jgi:hypothetical protein